MGKLTREYHRVDALASGRQDSLISEIIALDSAVFSEPTPRHVVDAYRGIGVGECWVMLVRSRGKLIAHNTVRIWYEEGESGRYALWRSRAAVLKAHRKAAVTGQFAIRLYVRFRMRFPLLRIYALNTLIHPSSFRLFATRVNSLYPFPKRELSADHRDVYERAMTRLGLQRVDGGPDFLVVDPTVVDTDDTEASYWERSAVPCIQFFVSQNPNYRTGQAVATFNPLTLPVVISMGLKHALRRLEKNVRRVLGLPDPARRQLAEKP